MKIFKWFLFLFDFLNFFELKGNTSIGYYYITVYFGQQQQEQSLIFDTGSGNLITDCDTCQICGPHEHRPYEISQSQTETSPNGFLNYICENSCDFFISFGEGSSYDGKFYKEIISFEKNKNLFNMIIGCVVKETNLFYTQIADGIIGFSPERDMPSIFQALMENKQIDKKQFSVCVGLDGGAFGFDWNINLHLKDSEIIWIDQSEQNWTYEYFMKLNKIQIEDFVFELNQKAFLDTGTTLTYLTADFYDKISDYFDKFCSLQKQNCDGNKKFQKCYSKSLFFNKTDQQIAKTFPIINFYFNDQKIEWLPELYFSFSNTDFCFGFDKDNSSDYNTLGATFMRNYDILFDIDKKQIGFAKAQCGAEEHIHRFLKHNLQNPINKQFQYYYENNSFFQRKFGLNDWIIYLLISILIFINFIVWKQKKLKFINREFFVLDEY